MRSVRLHLTIPGQPSVAVQQALTDLGRDLGWASGPLPATTRSAGSGVGFHQGLLRWVREGRPADVDYSVAVLDGWWSCVDDGDGTAVSFGARVDLCSPARPWRHPDAETIAMRALLDDAVGLVAGLFTGGVRVDDIVIQAAHPARSVA